jgi:hypothetical protein
LLEKADLVVSLFHESSLRSLEVWACGPKRAALEKAQNVLHALIQTADRAEVSRVDTVRRYELGTGSKIKDFRTGKTTTLVEQVFKGRLDLVVRPVNFD